MARIGGSANKAKRRGRSFGPPRCAGPRKLKLPNELSSSLQHFANTLGRVHHSGMNAYPEDLRKKIVEAKERGMPTVEVARTFGVGLSSVKRYAKVARQGGSL